MVRTRHTSNLLSASTPPANISQRHRPIPQPLRQDKDRYQNGTTHRVILLQRQPVLNQVASAHLVALHQSTSVELRSHRNQSSRNHKNGDRSRPCGFNDERNRRSISHRATPTSAVRWRAIRWLFHVLESVSPSQSCILFNVQAPLITRDFARAAPLVAQMRLDILFHKTFIVLNQSPSSYPNPFIS